ncbi:leucine-rich repeat protein [Metamycoplasma hyosynoviae]|uniref:leucine-rich repeat protein n=1 Tax=Metamycoplasma hyosynoviae TaxID=29559 RepID=UPI0023618B16|nr:leucine-rich repeat protein [Metamycoplasma hyosynoviae]MDD1379114.1 leucine-rich repeat protein [Metamycoplasma hyosynoviae]
MKEQEQKNLNTQQPKQQVSEDKVKTQNPKNKVIVWSSIGAATAALSSIVSLSTVFSNQRKVSFLDKVLQSIKIDVKDKENKTKADITKIADFEASNLDGKLYELIVETDKDEVDKQPLDSDKPYTTFRTKFAIRNKINNAQSNYRFFEFRDLKPPKEKVELNKLGQISEKEEDRVNDKVKIEFINFIRGQHLASEVAKKENGKFKHFNIYLKQDNDDALQYEIVNIDVTTNDDEAEAIFSYKLKVKSIEDEKFISDKLEIKFKDFAIPSTKLTDYLKSLNVNYKDVASTYVQDATEKGIVEGTPLANPNYQLEFETFEKLEDDNKIKAKVKIVDRSTKESSEVIEVIIAGFFDYKKAVEDAANGITFDYTDKSTTFASSLKKTNLTNTLTSQANSNNLEVIYYGDELIQEDETNSTKRTNVIVSYKIKDKKTQFESGEKTFTINGFKYYAILTELDEYLNGTNVISVDGVESKEAIQVNQLSHLKQDIDPGFEIDAGSVEISHPADLVSIKVSFRIKDKTGRSDIFSSQRQIEITGFKMPLKLVNDLAQQITFDVVDKQNTMAYDLWDNFNAINLITKDSRIEFVTEDVKVKQTDKDKITVTYKVKDAKNPSTVSQEYSKVISNFKTLDQNEQDFTYEIIERNGHKVASLEQRLRPIFQIPAFIGSYRVKKVGTMYSNETFGSNYFVKLDEGIEEIDKLIINSYDEFHSQVVGIKLPKTIKKINTLISGESGDLHYLEMYDNIETITNLFSTYSNDVAENVVATFKYYNNHAYYFEGRDNFSDLVSVTNPDIKGSFKLKLISTGEQSKIALREDVTEKFTYLETKDQKQLIKFLDKKESEVKFKRDIPYEKIGKNAFTGNKLEEFILRAANLNKLDYFVFDQTNRKLKKVDLQNKKKDTFNFGMIADSNTIEELYLADFESDDGENIYRQTGLDGWNNLKKLRLPRNIKEIRNSLIDGNGWISECNFNELTMLTRLGVSDVNQNNNIINKIFRMSHLDLSNTKIESIGRQTFWYPHFGEITLPKTLKYVGPIAFWPALSYEEVLKASSNDESVLSTVILTFGNMKINIKEIDKKPEGWSKYWIGQHWNESQPTGTSNITIEWNK